MLGTPQRNTEKATHLQDFEKEKKKKKKKTIKLQHAFVGMQFCQNSGDMWLKMER